MDVQLSWLAIGLATLAAMVVGSLWYAPFAFGKQWQKLVGLTDKQKNEAGWASIAIATITSFITAYVLAHVTYLSAQFYTDVSFTMSGVLTGFYLWLGVAATTIITHDTFELRPPKLTMIKVSSQLVTLLVMGLIIGLIGV